MSDTATRSADELDIAPKDRVRLFHVYLPYSLFDGGLWPPPVGAKALCGHRRKPTATDEVRYWGDPLQCAVCTDMAEGLMR